MDFTLDESQKLYLKYYARDDMREFRILPEGSIELCTKEATRRLNDYITTKQLDPAKTFFDDNAHGAASGRFPCINEFSQDVGIRFVNGGETYGQASLELALKVLEGMKRAAEVGYVETAMICIYKSLGEGRVSGYGRVDLIALEIKQEAGNTPETA